MCLILFSYQLNAKTPLILGANRDEYFIRPTLAAGYWDDYPTVLAGRDLVAGGTWIGITKTGRFAALTNIREANRQESNLRNADIRESDNKQAIMNAALVTSSIVKSRGDLTKAFLTGTQSCENYLQSIIENPQNYKTIYAGFNLLVGEFNQTTQSLFYLNNREDGFQKLTAGLYGLSNHRLNTPWPKVSNGKQELETILANNYESLNRLDSEDADSPDLHKAVREILENPALAPDKDLPATGLSYENEKALSASFIDMPLYGTRTSTVITLQRHGLQLSEQNYLSSTYQKDNFEKKSYKKEIDKSAAIKNTRYKNFKINFS
jgi:uncharacterized protein with NRDE domain